MIVRDILKNKGYDIHSISADQTVFEAIAKMDELDIGALVVMDGSQLMGILSERDYRSKVILKGRTSKETKVSTIMTGDVICVGPQDSVESCMSIMTDKKIRHLPVLENNSVRGVISIGDLVKAIISKQKGEISHLRHYIQGEYPR
ncbi:CBS domain-containing protein [Aliifodinibius sp. 1BSP15-2V2]|uniref:CBS domain-containing protein n=2 Tax=Fodinibius salsisoli TaxID=2820877 RepID=A0ABT3PNI6_9BACT|nr:CBS domain-containing protein [Fodinibius salsisoli]MCW9707417.1 CBS domain-containing protein [Fodinibius salsisoli]